MPYEKLTHDECRRNVCFFCISKADRQLSSGIMELVITLVPNYDSIKDYLPAGLCSSCGHKKRNNKELPYQNYNQIYSVLSKVKNLRSENCTCFVRDGKTYCKKDYVRYVMTFTTLLFNAAIQI